MNTHHFFGLLAASVLFGSLLVAVAAPPSVRIGDFSAQSPVQSLPAGWEEIRFGQNESSTAYDLIRTDSGVVVRARSNNAASGLITHERVDLTQYPILEWRWKVDRVPDGANVTADTTDDAAARVYVTFDYGGLGVIDRIKLMILRQVGYAKAPSRALNYLWATHSGRERVVPSPYTEQIMMIPVRTGSSETGEWVHEQRNVLADYRRVFGADPPPVNGVAIMTDTDNTGGTAEAYYGDIVFRSPRDTMDAVSAGAR